MSIEQITDKIINDAGNEARQVMEKAEGESQKLLDRARSQAESIERDAEVKGIEDAVLVKDRKHSVALLEARKLKLAAKQDAIKRSFEAALDHLSGMDETEYMKLLVHAVAKTGADGGELVLNLRDKTSFGKKIVQEINAGRETGRVVLSEETIDAKGGFVLRRGSMEINSSLETMVNAIKESVTPEVVQALF